MKHYKWYQYGTTLYKADIAKMDIEHIENVTKEDKRIYLNRRITANNVSFKCA